MYKNGPIQYFLQLCTAPLCLLQENIELKKKSIPSPFLNTDYNIQKHDVVTFTLFLKGELSVLGKLKLNFNKNRSPIYKLFYKYFRN